MPCVGFGSRARSDRTRRLRGTVRPLHDLLSHLRAPVCARVVAPQVLQAPVPVDAVAAAVRFKANGDRIITFADESDAKAASHEQSSRNSLAVHMKATDQKLTDMQGQIAAINDTLKLILSAVVTEDRREETQL